MEDKETLLFEVIFDAPKVQERVELLSHVIAQLRKEKQATEKDFKKGVVGAEEYAKSIASIDAQLVKAQSDFKSVSKEIANYEKVQKAAAVSVDQVKARLDALIPAYQAMSKEQRENTVSGQALQAQIRELAAEQKAIQDSYSATARIAGVYGSSLVDLGNQISDLSEEYDNLSESQRKQASVGGALLKRIDDLKDAHEREQKVIDNSRKGVKEYIKEINVLGFNVGSTIESFKSGANGAITFAKGLTTVRGAMTALVAVPIVAAFAFIVAILTKTQAGLDFIERSTASVTAVFNTLINRSVAITNSLLKIFTEPKQAVIELKDEILGLFSAATDAAAAANKITESNQRLRESERAVNVERAKNRAEIERLNLLSEDVSKSTAVRQKAAQDAYALERKTLKAINDIQRERIANEKASYELSTKTAADRDKIAEAEIAFADSQEESLSKQTEINNRLNQIKLDGIQKAREAAQLAAAESVAEGERALIRAKQKGIDTLKIEEEVIRRRGVAEKAGIEKGAEQRKLVDARVNAEILELRVAHALELQKQASTTEAAAINSSLALARRGSKEVNDLQIREIRRQAQDQLAELEALHKKKLISEDDYNERLGDIQNSSNRAIDDKRKEYSAAEINRIAELGKLRIETENDLSNDLYNSRRNQAVALINLEEKQQLDLLKLEEMDDTDRLTRQNAIQARAIALRKEQYRLIQADMRAERRADIETQIAETYGDNKKALDLQKRLLAVQRDDELANTELSEKQKAAIKAKYRRIEADMQRDYNKRQLDMVLESISQSTDALGKIFDAQAQANADLLERQQSAALKSAGLSAEARAKIEEDFAKKKEKMERDAAEKRRKIATVENIISVARGVTDAIVKNMGNPIMQALQIALVVATGASNQALIAAQKFAKGGVVPDQKLAYGGVVIGPSHAEGGVKYQIGRQQVELEGGEGVINKWAMKIPYVRRKASELNQMAGNGVAFNNGNSSRSNWRDSIRRVQYRPPVRMAMGGITPTSAIDYNLLTESFVKAVSQLPPSYVSVADVRQGVGRQVKVEQGADF